MGIGAKTAAGYGRMTVDTRPGKLRFEERPKGAPRETSGPPQDSTLGRAPRESSAARRREPWPVLVERVDLRSAPKAVPEILGGLEGEEKRRAANAILGRFGREKKLIRELRRQNESWFALVIAVAQAETTESGEPEDHQESDRAKPS